MMMDTYGMDSAVLRTLKLKDRGEDEKAGIAADMTRLFCNEALHRIEIRARDVLSAATEGDMLSTSLVGLRRVVKHQPLNTVALRRKIAQVLIEKEEWPF